MSSRPCAGIGCKICPVTVYRVTIKRGEALVCIASFTITRYSKLLSNLCVLLTPLRLCFGSVIEKCKHFLQRSPYALFVLDHAGRAAVSSVLDFAFVSREINAFLHLHLFRNGEDCIASSFASAAGDAFVAGFIEPNFCNCHKIPLILVGFCQKI